jgi:hypothetical protein
VKGVHRYLEVRCCCEPMKLLGLLPIGPSVHVRVGERVRYTLSKQWRELTTWPPTADPIRPGPCVLELEMVEWDHYRIVDQIGVDAPFPLRTKIDGGIAFRSDETPIEVLRCVPGFIEHPA